MQNIGRASGQALVITHLMGGLGNQMFQYAAGRALALRCGSRLKLDLTRLESTDSRWFELDKLPIDALPATATQLAALGAGRVLPPGLLIRVMRRLGVWRSSLGPCVYQEPHFHFDPAVLNLRPPVLLVGYWQSEKYFVDYAETIRRELTPTIPLDSANGAIAAHIKSVNAVSVHVRRGDYVHSSVTGRYHGTCPIEYYRCAIDYLSARVEAPHAFVFSDDRDWSRENLRFAVPTTFVEANSPQAGYRDMQLMTQCRHHVIANSSFSWWGAWLSTAPGKIVIAPRHWFKASRNDTRDLIPDAWVRL